MRCGADHAVLSDGWLAAVRDLLGERAVDIVVDPVGSDRMTDSLRSLAPEGRLLVLGFAGGEIPVVKVNRLLLGNTGVLGVASREFFEQHPALVTELWGQLMELRRTGALADPPVEVYPFADARGALRAIAGPEGPGQGRAEPFRAGWRSGSCGRVSEAPLRRSSAIPAGSYMSLARQGRQTSRAPLRAKLLFEPTGPTRVSLGYLLSTCTRSLLCPANRLHFEAVFDYNFD